MNLPDKSKLFQETLSQGVPRIAPALEHSATLHLALFGRDGRMLWANPAMLEFLESDASKLIGRDITEFLATFDTEIIKGYLAGTERLPDGARLVNFLFANGDVHTLNCSFVPVDNGLFLLGEPMVESNRSLQEELLVLNRHLAVLSRENTRKGRLLEKSVMALSQEVEQRKKVEVDLVRHRDQIETILRERMAELEASNFAAHLSVPVRFRRKARVLVADDNLMNQRVVVGILKNLGVTADHAADGREALEALSATCYDLVFMDVQMPLMDGRQVARAIRECEAKDGGVKSAASSPGSRSSSAGKLPIIAMMSHAPGPDREACMAAGMSDCILKPLAPESVVAILNQWLPDPSVPAGAEPVPSSGGGNPAVYDRAAFLSRLMGNETFAREMERDFLLELPPQIEQLKTHIARGEAKPAAEMAHMIKGAAASISAEAMCETASRINEAAKGGDTAPLRALVLDLDRQFDRLKAAIRSGSAAGS